LEESVKSPLLFHIRYRDGLVANVLVLNGAARHWSVAWQLQDGEVAGTQFWVHEDAPYMHFSNLLDGVNLMMQTGKPAWPVERTLLTSGMLHALFQSRVAGKSLDTPHLQIAYQSPWTWKQPTWPAAVSR
jgi:hypothetical protein